MPSATAIDRFVDVGPAVLKKVALRCPLEPSPTAPPPTRYDVEDVEGWSAALAADGYVVIREVADANEVSEAHKLFWDWLAEAEAGVSPDAPETWGLIPCERANGIIFSRGIGQSAFAWHARGLPKVRRAFGRLWQADDDDVITSFDGANVFRPFLEPAGAREHKTGGGWWHTDQSGHRTGLQCVQGLVAFTAATPATGGLVVLPGSHLRHAELAERYPHVTHDYLGLAPEDPILTDVSAGAARGALLVQCGAGDLVLWDSRVVHCNAPALSYAPQQGEARLLRLVSYVCMTPRAWADESTLATRRLAVDHLVTSTHWPHQFRVTSCAAPGGDAARLERLTPSQLALV